MESSINEIQEIFLLDPVECLPDELTVLIFGFLKGQELLEASLVSSSWYNSIADAPECMKKIKIKDNCNFSPVVIEEMISTVVNSRRKYVNLEVSRCVNYIGEIYPLFATTKKQWKWVKIINTNFQSVNQAIQFIGCIEHSVQELTMIDVFSRDICNYNMKTKKFTFPNLKVLRLENVHSSFFHDFFEDVTTLKEFELCGQGLTVRSLNTLIELLKDNHKIEKLAISGNVFNQMMYTNYFIKDLKFKLKELTVKTIYQPNDYYNTIQGNFVQLLNSQSGSLTSLTLFGWMGIKTLQAVFALPKLTSLTLNGFTIMTEIVMWKKLELKTSQTIVNMKLEDIPHSFELVKVLVTAAPQLISFKISVMDKRLMHYMTWKHKNLRSLSVDLLTAKEASSKDFFSTLKSLQITWCKTALFKNFNEKSVDMRNNFENLLFKATHGN